MCTGGSLGLQDHRGGDWVVSSRGPLGEIPSHPRAGQQSPQLLSLPLPTWSFQSVKAPALGPRMQRYGQSAFSISAWGQMCRFPPEDPLLCPGSFSGSLPAPLLPFRAVRGLTLPRSQACTVQLFRAAGTPDSGQTWEQPWGEQGGLVPSRGPGALPDRWTDRWLLCLTL